MHTVWQMTPAFPAIHPAARTDGHSEYLVVPSQHRCRCSPGVSVCLAQEVRGDRGSHFTASAPAARWPGVWVHGLFCCLSCLWQPSTLEQHGSHSDSLPPPAPLENHHSTAWKTSRGTETIISFLTQLINNDIQ